jgi:hypothetical protein
LREGEHTIMDLELGTGFAADGFDCSGDVFAQDYGVFDEGEG